MPLEDFIITVYCLVDDLLKNVSKGQKLRQRGFLPKLTDSEIITMQIIAELKGIDTDKGAWLYFSTHWQKWFPNIGSYSNYAKHAANLWAVLQVIQKELAVKLNAYREAIHIADGFPMPVCQFKRAYFSRIFADEASYGFLCFKG